MSDLGMIMRWIGLAVGLALILITWRSIITTIILPRFNKSFITFATWHAVRSVFLCVADRQSTYEHKDRILALLGPVALLATLVSWMSMFLLGYGLMFWPLIDGSFSDCLRLAGSSFFTLGLADAPQSGPTILEFTAAATGMIIVALQIGYLPTIYSAYNRRETLVTALSSRAGVPPWGPELLARHQLVQGMATLPALFAAWEIWAADIRESHASYPWLMSFRSPDALESWVMSLLAVLDAAALYLAVAPSQAPPEARQCLRSGYVTLRLLARISGTRVNEDPRPDDPIELSFAAFMRGIEHMRAAGVPMEQPAEDAWRDYHGWRVNYEAAIYVIADFIVAAPAPWAGQRRFMTSEEAFDVLTTRPRHRTPDDPEGLTGIGASTLRELEEDVNAQHNKQHTKA
ncbi:MAG: hypothetical protein HGA19_02165 [Oscillochloris sp.]|nr:hypothetical protein [Oscillochloris sp.]